MKLLLEIAKTIVLYFRREKIIKTGRDTRRIFSRTQQIEIWTRQDGKCKDCGIDLDWHFVVFHHVTPWHEGGKTVLKNGVALCPICHRKRTFSHQLEDMENKRENEQI